MGRLTRLFFHSPYMADSDKELSDKDGGNEGNDVAPNMADAAPEGDEDPETLKKRLRDTQEALRKRSEEIAELKKGKAAAAPKGKGEQAEPEKDPVEDIEKIAVAVYENKETDMRFFDSNPELARFKSALQDLRAKTDRTLSLAEIAVRYGFSDQAKLDAAKGRLPKGTQDRKSVDAIPAAGTPEYEEWRKANLSQGSVYRRLR